MITFKETHIDIPGLLAPGAIVPIKFEFEGNPEDIKTVSPSCGCTADCKKQGNTVVATFTEKDAINVNKAHYPKGVYNFTKTINVFLVDQTTIKLTFSGNVALI